MRRVEHRRVDGDRTNHDALHVCVFLELKDDERAVIDAAKLAEEQKEDAIWDAAHFEYDAIERDKKVAADAVKAEQEKQAEARKLEAKAEAKETERLRLASEDKKWRMICFTDAVKDLHRKADVSMEKADEIMTLISNEQIRRTGLNFQS